MSILAERVQEAARQHWPGPIPPLEGGRFFRQLSDAWRIPERRISAAATEAEIWPGSAAALRAIEREIQETPLACKVGDWVRALGRPYLGLVGQVEEIEPSMDGPLGAWVRWEHRDGYRISDQERAHTGAYFLLNLLEKIEKP